MPADLILGLDCALGPAQVAVARALLSDDRPSIALLARERDADGAGAAERLFALIDRALTQAGGRLSDVGRIAVTTGPGRFTSLRIGLAAARGLALARAVPISGHSVFAVLAAGLKSDALVGLAVPGGKGDIAWQKADLGRPIGPMGLDPPDRLPVADVPLWAGPAADLVPGARVVGQAGVELANLIQLAVTDLHAAGALSPVYARPPDAVIAEARLRGP